MVKEKTKSEENPDQVVSSVVEEFQKTEEFVGGEELTEKTPKNTFLVEKISPESEPPVTQSGELVCPFCLSKNVRPMEAEDETAVGLAEKTAEKLGPSRVEGEILPEAAKTEQEPAGQAGQPTEPTASQIQAQEAAPETGVTPPPTPTPQEISQPGVVSSDDASKAGLST
jgi:hypothetical protein